MLHDGDQRFYKSRHTRCIANGFLALEIGAGFQVRIVLRLSQPLYHMNDETLEHLAHHLIRTFDENVHRPPEFRGHVREKPFASLLIAVELFCQQFNPKHHRWLSKWNEKIAIISISEISPRDSLHTFSFA